MKGLLLRPTIASLTDGLSDVTSGSINTRPKLLSPPAQVMSSGKSLKLKKLGLAKLGKKYSILRYNSKYVQY